MGLAMLWSSKTLSTILERRFAEKSKVQAEQVKLLLNERQETATGLVHWIAEMPEIRAALESRDRARLFQHLLPLVGSIQMDFIEILDRNGKIFLRVQDPQWRRDDASPSLEVQLPLETDRGMEGVISIFFPSQEMTTAVGVLQKTLLAVALLGSVLALSISWFLGRRLTRPQSGWIKLQRKLTASTANESSRIS
jgi:sensor histidine kinase regulating citrate/malate metabolism